MFSTNMEDPEFKLRLQNNNKKKNLSANIFRNGLFCSKEKSSRSDYVPASSEDRDTSLAQI